MGIQQEKEIGSKLWLSLDETPCPKRYDLVLKECRQIRASESTLKLNFERCTGMKGYMYPIDNKYIFLKNQILQTQLQDNLPIALFLLLFTRNLRNRCKSLHSFAYWVITSQKSGQKGGEEQEGDLATSAKKKINLLYETEFFFFYNVNTVSASLAYWTDSLARISTDNRECLENAAPPLLSLTSSKEYFARTKCYLKLLTLSQPHEKQESR